MSSFKNKYVNEAVSKLSLLYGNDEETLTFLRKRVQEIYEEKLNSKPEPNLKVTNNYRKSEFSITPTKLLDVLEDKKPIVTGYGTLFKHEDNVPGKILKSLISKRKIAKNKMLSHVNDKDKTLHDMYDLEQKVIKVLSNAYYGAFGQSSFHFFNQFLGPSVTYTGVLIIQSAVLAFEAFLSGNFIFENIDELIHYCNNIFSNEETFDDILLFDKEIEKIDDKLKKWLVSHCDFSLNEMHMEMIDALIENLSYYQKEVLLTKNNMKLFMSSKYISDLILKCVNDKFTDANHPPKEIEDDIEELKGLTRYYVMYPYQWNNKEYKAERLREVVPISDTDSAFIYLGPFTNWYKDKKVKNRLTRIERITCSNVFTFLAANLVREVFAILTKNLNVPEAERGMIEMKNEFFYSRISISENKKQYAGLCDSKEGKIYSEPKIDVKGLPIKKVSTPKIARAIFTDILKKDILEAEEINPLDVFNKFLNFEKEIKESLLKGETKFTKPSKFTATHIYKLPHQIQAVRGVLLWNALYPKEFIPDFSSVNLVRLKSMTKEEAEIYFEAFGKGKCISSVSEEIRKMEFKVKSKLPDLSKRVSVIDEIEYRNIEVIAVPKNLEQLPEEIVPLINLNEIIDGNMKNGNILMNIVGFSTLRSLKYDSYSNVISI